jgi:hypothetical protein
MGNPVIEFVGVQKRRRLARQAGQCDVVAHRLHGGNHQRLSRLDHALVGGYLVVQRTQQLANPAALGRRHGTHRNVTKSPLVQHRLARSTSVLVEPAGLQRVIPISRLLGVFRPAHQRVLGSPHIGIAIAHAAAVRAHATNDDQWTAGVVFGRVSDRPVGAVYGKPPLRSSRRRATTVAEVEVITQPYSHCRRPTWSRTTPSNRADSSSALSRSAVNRAIFSSTGSPSSAAAAAPTYRPGVSV